MLRKTSLNTSLLMSVFLVAMVCSITAGEAIHVDANLAEYAGPLWSFTTVGGEAQPDYPEDGAMITGDPYTPDPTILYTELIFIPGATAVKHTGYFSKNRDEVANRVEDANLGLPPFSDPRSAFYDEVTYYAGIPLSYWELVRDYYDPYVINPTAGFESLERGQVYYWTVDETDAEGNVFSGDIWEFTIQCFKACAPSPPNEATFVSVTPILSWGAGYGAQWYDIYFGTSLDWDPYPFPIIGPPPWTQPGSDTDWDPIVDGGLTIEFGTTYYWRIDAVQGRFPPSPGTIYKGDVWCFTTVPGPIFVDVDADGANNGTSWADAHNYLQDALIEADSALKPVEIRVAEGIYTPDSNSASPNGNGDRTATFQLINGVTLKGAYAGFGEANPNERDIELYETILSGDLGGNDRDVNDPFDLHSDPCRTDNSYNVVYANSTDVTSVLDGFTITASNDDFSFPPLVIGGMYNLNANPTVTNCTFSANVAFRGSGMYNLNANPTVTNCTFSANVANSGGSGMYNFNANPTVTNCTFSGNVAFGGGSGMDNFESSPTVTNCIFSQNWAQYLGGGMYNYVSSPTVTNCTFVDNTADAGGGISNFLDSSPTVTNCIIRGTGPDEIFDEATCSTNVTYSNIQGGWPGDGNIDADPCFVDVNNGDYHLKSQVGRWEPNSKSWVLDDDTSPCIDAGNPGCPLGDEPEPNGNRRNMGTYGGTAEASKSPAYWRSIADITNDWRVDFNDLKIFADYWLETGECIPGDLNRNKSVDFADFALAALHWQEDNNPKRYCVVEDDVKYCIRTDKSVYHLGETVEILYRITNLGSVPVSLGWAPIPPFCYRFAIVDNNGEHVWQWSWEMPPIPPVEFILDAYESKEYEIGWEMINDNGTYETEDDFPIGPGMYKITGELLTGSEEDRVKVSVSVNVRE